MNNYSECIHFGGDTLEFSAFLIIKINNIESLEIEGEKVLVPLLLAFHCFLYNLFFPLITDVKNGGIHQVQNSSNK